jgi:putative tricarboxylic transport membrane protein
MLQQLLDGFLLFATLESFIALGLGVFIGVIVGAIPGLTTPMAVALTLPFTFTLSPVTGILLLLGVYKGGIYGGSITAILINAPGTPAASCTVLDGYPMAKRGEAKRALDIALYSSCVADFISNIALILFAGVLASFALKFGPAEVFTLIFFSLTIISGVSGTQLLKGMASACLGLLLATIGMDLVYGTNRFIFGQTDLLAGLNFIPVLIGLFAVPEILNFFCKEQIKLEKNPLAGIGASIKDFFRCFKTIIRGSFIGVILGAIPGIGAAPSAFLSYSEAKRTSKNADNFGKGEIEGVAAAEAGNNGVAGATMIPLLALGIPGDVITAIILGAFMIHGLRPGPLMFNENIELIYAIFMGIMLSSIYLFGIGKICIKFISKISDIPHRILFPVVLILCIFGSYAVNNSTFDIAVMFLMGILGFAMLKLNIPTAPFLIGFILGPMLEDSFRQSLLISRGSYAIFFSTPICWFFWVLTVIIIGMSFWTYSKSKESALLKIK